MEIAMLQVQSVSDLGQADAASGARVHEPGAGAVAAFLRGIARRWQRRLDRAHLAALEPRLLQDIGIERQNIDTVLGTVPLFCPPRC